MMTLQLQMPTNKVYPTTQTFAEHVARAKMNGWCYQPGNCPSGIYYYGGIDWGMQKQTPLYAAHDGTLSVKTQSGGYGKHARIKFYDGSNLVEIIYGHMDSFKGNDRLVKQGELIGYSGNTGNSTGPHLHFELRINGVPNDPIFYIASEQPTPQPPENDEILGNMPTLGYQVIVEPRTEMNLRIEPGNMNASSVIGYLPAKTRSYVIEYKQIGNDLWACIGGYPYQWVAIYYDGVVYCDFVKKG